MKRIAYLLLMLILTSSMCVAEENGCTHTFSSEHPYVSYCTVCEREVETAYVKCGKCDGAGKIRCSSCYGTGSKRCSICKALGNKGCGFCSYTGRVSCKKYDTCSQCSGSGNSPIKLWYCQTCSTTFVCQYCGSHKKETKLENQCPLCNPDAYPTFQYNAVMRNASDHLGERFSMTGTVASINRLTYWQSAETGLHELYRLTIMQTENEKVRSYTAYYERTEEQLRLLEGDSVVFYGTLAYEDSQMRPTFFAQYIQLN